MPLDPQALAQFPLFAGLSQADLAQVSQLLHRRNVQAGTLLMASEQPGEFAYLIIEGTVKIVAEMADGRQTILAFLGAGDMVGEMSLIDSSGRSATVIAIEPLTVLTMDRVSFTKCLRTLPDLTYNLVRMLCSRLRLANEQIRSLSSLDVAGRLARQLAAFAERYGRSEPSGGTLVIGLRLTQTDLGELVGASRERVNQVMGELKQRGLISSDSAHRILVHDLPALADLAA